MTAIRLAGCVFLLLSTRLLSQVLPDDLRLTRFERTLIRIDREVEKLDAAVQAKTMGRGGVAGLIARSYAAKYVGSKRAFDLATYDFNLRSRDHRRSHCLMEFGNGRSEFSILRAGGMNGIWDLGVIEYAQLPVGTFPYPTRDFAVPVRDHAYVLRFRHPEHETTWLKLQVLGTEPSEYVIFQWEKLTDVAALQKAKREGSPVLTDGFVNLQLRGSARRRRIALSGETTNVREVVKQPIARGRGGVSQAYIRGGLIPIGTVWDVRRVVWESEHRSRRSDLRIALGGNDLVYEKPGSVKEKGEWSGRAILRPGDEHQISAEITGSGRCSVRIYGVVRPEAEANTVLLPPLDLDEKQRLEGWINGLDADATWKTAFEGIQSLGVRVVRTLRVAITEGRSAAFKGRLQSVLDELSGD